MAQVCDDYIKGNFWALRWNSVSENPIIICAIWLGFFLYMRDRHELIVEDSQLSEHWDLKYFLSLRVLGMLRFGGRVCVKNMTIKTPITITLELFVLLSYILAIEIVAYDTPLNFLFLFSFLFAPLARATSGVVIYFFSYFFIYYYIL